MRVSTLFALFLEVSLCSRAHSFAVPPSQLSVSAISRPNFSLKATDVNIGSFPEDEEDSIQLSETEIELIFRNVKQTIDIPFLPPPVEKEVVKAALKSFCKYAPVALPEGVFADLVSGKQNWNHIKTEVIQELNDAICIPIVPREVQDKIVDTICTIMFISDSGLAKRRQMVGKALQTALNQDSDEEFATMLNGMIDIPFMNEEQEQEVLLKLAKKMHDAFETMVPEEMRQMLTNSSPEELREARKNLIDRMNEKIDIPFKSEEEERDYFEAIVDYMLKRYGLEKGTKMPDEELEDIVKELDIIEVELDVQASIHERKMEELTDKKNSLRARKGELEKLV